MICLGIESSCDETALALVDAGRLRDSIMSSQADLHALFGGVVPEIASREHARLIGPLFDVLMQRNALSMSDIDVVSFARGPGLLGSLLVGAAFAKALALGSGCQLVGVNHLHAHLLAAGLDEELRFPALGLLVSGGHTHIYRINSFREFILLGKTLDDAAGEAFDKVGKVLGLAYPAGRSIDLLAQQSQTALALFRCPYIANDTLDFSFSGLKTAAGDYISAHPDLVCANPEYVPGHRADFCAALANTIARTLRIKLERALMREHGIQSLIVAGGVAANSQVRAHISALAREKGLVCTVPKPALCTDNGSMIAYSGWLLAEAGFGHAYHVSCVPRGTPVPDDLDLYPAS